MSPYVLAKRDASHPNKAALKHLPMISIVTPSFNQASFIEEALKSVQAQNYTNYEHLVIDGMSTDGTLDVVRCFIGDSDQTKLSWISERDSGQSEALNKGFRHAKGEIIGWLNSDDRYRAGCFEHIVQAFADSPEIDIVYGDYLIVDEFGKVLETRREIEFNEFILLYHRVLYIPTTATFFRRRIFEEGNWLNEELQYAMDLEFFIRLAARGYRFRHLSEILADFRRQPNSKTCSAPQKQRLEHQQVIVAAAPICRCVKTPAMRRIVLIVLRSIAGIRRYLEKLLRGYYWEQLRPKRSGSNNL